MAGTAAVNGAQHRAEAMASIDLAGTIYQVAGFWDINRKMNLAVRTLPSTTWDIYVYDGAGGLPDIALTPNDYHRTVNVGLDPDGYIHVSYNLHDDPLTYRTGVNTIDSFDGALSAEKLMLGTDRESGQVTYPNFFNAPNGKLYFLARMDGISGEGNLYFYEYDETTTTWGVPAGAGTEGLLIDGLSTTPDYSPYWSHVVFDDDFGSGGYMHLCWTWRRTSTLNSDIAYLRWDGTNWETVSGAAATIPATYDNTTALIAIPESDYLLNNPEMDVDSLGNLHFAYVKKHTTDANKSGLWYSFYDGSVATYQIINNPLSWDGSNTDRYQFARPRVLVDRSNDRVYVPFRERDVYFSYPLTLFSDDNGVTWDYEYLQVENVGDCEIVLDRNRWDRDGVMSLQVPKWLGNVSAWPVYLVEYALPA